MASKAAFYAAMAEEASGNVTRSWDNWTGFLGTAARMYKYPYDEQLMIHAQRPNATACAEYDLWNNTMRRYVKKGSKGIALVDMSGQYPKLRYVFDVADTGARANSRPINLWAMKDEYRKPLEEAFKKDFGVSGNLESQIFDAAENLARDYWRENGNTLLDIVEDSFLEEYDELNIEVAFRRAVAASVAYQVYSRCTDNPMEYLDREDFRDVFDFNTRQTANALGEAVNGVAREVFREITEVTREYEKAKAKEQALARKAPERSKEHGRDDLQAGGGLSDPGHPADSDRTETPGQVRDDAQDIPSGAQEDAVHRPGADGEAVPAPLGGTGYGRETGEGDHGGASKEEPRAGQEDRSDGLGRAHEFAESPGRGDRDSGTYQQLSFFFPTEGEQIQTIDQMDMENRYVGNIFTERAESGMPSAFSFTDAEIADVLKYGSNSSHSRERIISQFERQKSVPEIASMLQREFHGGFGIRGNGGEYSAWYAEDGIHLARGNRARGSARAQVIPWNEAADRIKTMLDAGTFASIVELAEADGFVRSELALRILYLYHDLSAEAREMGFFPSLSELPPGYPDATASLAKSMSDTAFAAKLQGEYRQFLAAHEDDRSLLRFHYHRLDELRQGLDDLTLPHREYVSDMIRTPEIATFITEDEIDALFAGGSSVEGGKGRIYGYFSDQHSTKEKADFLKNEYGMGGRSHALSGSDGSSVDHDARGLRLAKRGCPEVRINWIQAAERVTKLIRQDRFFTPEEKQRYEEIRAQKENDVADVAKDEGISEPVAETAPTVESPEILETADPSLAESIALINEYTQREFGQDADYTDLERVDIAFTTTEYGGDIPIQVSADLIHQRMRYEVGDKEVATISFQDTEEFHDFLGGLDFSEQVSFAEEHWQEEQEQTGTQEQPAQPEPTEASRSDAVDEMLSQAEAEATRDAVEPYERFSLVETENGYAVWDDINDGYYVDGDGVTEEFSSRWQAEDYLAHVRKENADKEAAEWLYVERVKQAPEIEPETEKQPESEEPKAQERQPEEAKTRFSYGVGDTVYLDNGAFEIEQIGMFDIHLRDLSAVYPISRAINKQNFEAMLRRDERNDSYLPTDEQDKSGRLQGTQVTPESQTAQRPHATTNPPTSEPKTTTETVGYYPGDKNRLPFDVEIQKIRFDEPERDVPQEPTVEPANDVEPDIDDILDANPTSVQIDGEWRTFPNAEAVNRAMQEAETDKPQAQNFRILDDHLGEGGPKEKFWRNVKAIATLKQIEGENRQATPEEQHILSQYVGWGGLADAFDPNKDNWSAEYSELKGLLTDAEYTAARGSTLNAHYTSPTVIKAVYEAVGNMGFESGNILEPSMGVGNFFGLLPESMQDSKLYGVELDPITGRMAKLLYPQAEITVGGFETTDRRDFYDLAVGNVPFGDYKVNDRPYNKLGFSIHNYFFAKVLDQVRPGGVVAFLTSRYTMDAKSPEVRKYLAQRAELLGAIRLPNNAFKANAGTGVVSDIIFLQKRDRPIDIEPDWVHLGQSADGFAINSYFADNPEMVLGRMTSESTQYGRQEFTVEPHPDRVLSDLLHEAVQNIGGRYESALVEDTGLDGIPDAGGGKAAIPADPNVKNYSYTVVDGDIYFRENSIMRPVDLNDAAKGRVAGMVELRRIVNGLIECQMEDCPDNEVRAKQAELNVAYDSFTAKYGILNSRPNEQAFSEDSSYYLLCSLENVDDDGKYLGKADMFTKRTIRPAKHVESVDTPSEALAVSIGEKGCVDLPFMASLLGRNGDIDSITQELAGVIFKDPLGSEAADAGWQTADEYLSGNVRDKLRIAQTAAARDSRFLVNVEALTKAQPKDLDASEIDVRLGATWIGPDYIQKFMHETFNTPWYMRRNVEVKYSPLTAEWRVTGKSSPSYSDVSAYVTYGTERANAYKILEDTLNLRDVRIYDTVQDADGKEKRVLNKKETTLAQQKQQAIKEAFRDWVWKDPVRRETLVKKYNEMFNATRPREYDGSHIQFGGMAPDITLRPHQRGAIAHVLYGGNTLLAHEVGAGKTFEMAAAAMESKRLGLCQKSMFVVPNHLTLQWANEFLRLYPSAKILVTTKKDFETSRRKKFCARIATGDYDAVIIGHSQFEKIPISAERQERLLQEQIDEVTDALEELKYSRGENFTIKQMEKTRKNLQAKLDKLAANEKKDDVITFEQLGIDRLFVDESQAYKNLFLYTKMRNVAGLSTSEAQRSSDMFMKCRYMDEITGGRGVIFASGTPVSNSMTELYTVMRYLQYGTLQQKGLTHFDCWASTFGESTTSIELDPAGTGYRARTRFARFFNLPELMNMFKEVADIKTSDQLDLPVPEAKFETVVVQPSEIQKGMVQELSERATKIHSGAVDASVDNMLCITSDGRKIGLDQRLMNPLLPDDPGSKLNACVENVMKIWEEGKSEKLTQLLFCDMSTPKNDGSFNVYDDIKAKLMARGVPESEIAFIHNADTEAKKKDLFGKVRTGQVRVLLGSTQKMGAGTNVQDRLVAVHHLDVGWRPADMTQRNGRIIRQGNRNKEVKVFQYVTEGTFDAYLYQTLENKQKFISQIMTSKSPVRSCDDVDEQVLSFAEVKALCAGDSRIKEKMDLDIDVARLKVLKADHQSQQYRLEDKLLKTFPAQIKNTQETIRGCEADMRTVAEHPHPKDGFAGMEIHGRNYAEKADAGEALLEACRVHRGMEAKEIGSYRGFTMELSFSLLNSEFTLNLKGAVSHSVTLGTDPRGNLTRIDNALANIPQRLETAKERLTTLEAQREAAKAELGKPFPQEAEFAEKSARLAELDAELNMDDGPAVGENDGREADVAEKTDSRPSVLADLKSKASQVAPDTRTDRPQKEEVL